MLTAALFVLVEMGRVSSWLVILIVGQEFAVSGLRILAAVELSSFPPVPAARSRLPCRWWPYCLLLKWPFCPFLMTAATGFHHAFRVGNTFITCPEPLSEAELAELCLCWQVLHVLMAPLPCYNAGEWERR